MTLSKASFCSVYDLLVHTVSKHKTKTALHFEGVEVSFARFLENVDNAARHLREFGLVQGDVFAAYSQNCPEQLYCYYAAAKIGAVFVPVNPNLTPTEVAYTVTHSGAKVVFHDDYVADTAKSALTTDKLLTMSTLVHPIEGDDTIAPVERDDDFLIIYTSGSSGTPKGIVLDHAAQIDAPRVINQMWGITEGDKTLVALPIGYLYGLSTASAAGLQTGATLVILRRFHPRDVLDAIVTHDITVFHGVPTMYSMMLNYAEERELDFDLCCLRVAISAGAPLADVIRNRFQRKFGPTLQNYYAMTEATPVFGKDITDPAPIPSEAAGKAFPGTDIRIVRSDGSECDVGEAGELLVRAAATMKRYQGAPDLTEASMQDELFRSGDLVKRDEKGFYYIVGRIKELIIRGGANISPAEVEKVLMSHNAVQDACVVGAPDSVFGEVPVAFVTLRPGRSVTEKVLICHIEKELSDFKVPRTIYFENALPLGKTGKPDKALLQKWSEERLLKKENC